MTTDTDALTERLWEAVAEVRDQHPRVFNDAPTDDVIAAALPIVAKEVHKAKAEALREAATDIRNRYNRGLTLSDYAAHLLDRRATEYETGGSDDHR